MQEKYMNKQIKISIPNKQELRNTRKTNGKRTKLYTCLNNFLLPCENEN